MKPHERLKLARINAGFNSANAASSAQGWPQRSYLRHELGETDFAKMAAIYAEAFGVKPEYLIGPEAQDIADVLPSLTNSRLTEIVNGENVRILTMAPDGTAQIHIVKRVWLISQD